MASINGYTAEHMLAIENDTIVGAHISSSDLILEQKDGGTINVGSIFYPVTGSKIDFTNSITVGDISTGPESVTTASPGSLRMKSDGGLWLKESGAGNTGWKKVVTPNQPVLGMTYVCTSSTRPSSPAVGQYIYETNTAKELVYAGATSGWCPEWNTPWGLVVKAQVTASTGTTTTSYLDTGLTTGSYTPIANRQHRVTVMGHLDSTVANDVTRVTICNSSNTALQAVDTVHPAAAGLDPQFQFEYWETSVASATTRKARFARFYGTGNSKFMADAGRIAYIIVEDMGPSGLPS